MNESFERFLAREVHWWNTLLVVLAHSDHSAALNLIDPPPSVEVFEERAQDVLERLLEEATDAEIQKSKANERYLQAATERKNAIDALTRSLEKVQELEKDIDALERESNAQLDMIEELTQRLRTNKAVADALHKELEPYRKAEQQRNEKLQAVKERFGMEAWEEHDK